MTKRNFIRHPFSHYNQDIHKLAVSGFYGFKGIQISADIRCAPDVKQSGADGVAVNHV